MGWDTRRFANVKCSTTLSDAMLRALKRPWSFRTSTALAQSSWSISNSSSSVHLHLFDVTNSHRTKLSPPSTPLSSIRLEDKKKSNCKHDTRKKLEARLFCFYEWASSRLAQNEIPIQHPLLCEKNTKKRENHSRHSLRNKHHEKIKKSCSSAGSILGVICAINRISASLHSSHVSHRSCSVIAVSVSNSHDAESDPVAR